jgi:hypothetical protein
LFNCIADIHGRPGRSGSLASSSSPRLPPPLARLRRHTLFRTRGPRVGRHQPSLPQRPSPPIPREGNERRSRCRRTYAQKITRVLEEKSPLYRGHGPRSFPHRQFTRRKSHHFGKTGKTRASIGNLRQSPRRHLQIGGVRPKGVRVQHSRLSERNSNAPFLQQTYIIKLQVYAGLIKLVLNPDSCPLALPGLTLSPKTAQPDLELALELLKEHAFKMDPLEVLSVLPDNVPVTRIHKFLLVALQKAVKERRRVQLLKGLLYAEHLQCQEMRLHLQSQHVLVTELNVCPVCKKRFGNQRY